MAEKNDLVAIQKDAKDNCNGKLELAICRFLGAEHSFNRAGGKVPAFLTKEVSKIKGEITKLSKSSK